MEPESFESGWKPNSTISLGPVPLDREATVAQAWSQQGWADYSGVSRMLKACTPETVTALEAALGEISRPYIDREVMLALRDKQVLVYDGELNACPGPKEAGQARAGMDQVGRLQARQLQTSNSL